jgi:hypothetical protein
LGLFQPKLLRERPVFLAAMDAAGNTASRRTTLRLPRR